ncbi:hypothetical protein ALC62_14300 [Cyphomyrmex costatus]|uniref:Uncharacterized protein n=1 Tax=Cyphomyrmex costatus TaxID=456900 RepID=A0A151I8T9_9HYME|nr:hypothetical protein ALC62_14300 [Cyphomyrmex costatus]
MSGRREGQPMSAACSRECNRSCCGAYSPPRDVIIAADQSTGPRRRNEDDRDQERRSTEELQKVRRRWQEEEKKRDEARDRWSKQKYDWFHPPAEYIVAMETLLSAKSTEI